MITVEAMHLTPVKSLGLVHPTTVHVGRHGIAGSVSKVDMATRMPLNLQDSISIYLHF